MDVRFTILVTLTTHDQALCPEGGKFSSNLALRDTAAAWERKEDPSGEWVAVGSSREER